MILPALLQLTCLLILVLLVVADGLGGVGQLLAIEGKEQTVHS